MRSKKPVLTALWHALDEAAFGPARTLNLRESLPSAASARSRADTWLRMRQAMKTEEVLLITGRGNQSFNGVGVIRQEILGLLPSLRRCGVVTGWKEHTPGSFVVTLAPLAALLAAPKRRRQEPDQSTADADRVSLMGLEAETISLLRVLAIQNLRQLGIADPQPFVEQEMVRSFSILAIQASTGPGGESTLRQAIRKAIEEVD